jgi:hypothetical protein
MSAWHGPQRKGAARDRRTARRTEADARNARTKRSRRRKARLTVAPVRPCCGQRHYGVLCPDGLVMCCICFSRAPVAGLMEVPGGHQDVCLGCVVEAIGTPRER